MFRELIPISSYQNSCPIAGPRLQDSTHEFKIRSLLDLIFSSQSHIKCAFNLNWVSIRTATPHFDDYKFRMKSNVMFQKISLKDHMV